MNRKRHLLWFLALMGSTLPSNAAWAAAALQPPEGSAPAAQPPVEEEPSTSPNVIGPSAAIDVPDPPSAAAVPAAVAPIDAAPAPAIPAAAVTPSPRAAFGPALSLPTTPAESAAARSAPSAIPRRHIVGVAMDFGVPDGAGLGLSVRPVEWLRLGAAATHNGLAPGARVGITFDPMPTPVAITFTVEGGHYWSGTVPGIQGAPAVAYNYANVHLGLEFGNRSSFRFFLRGGASWLDMTASSLPSDLSGLSNLSYHGWMAPSAKLGFSLYF